MDAKITIVASPLTSLRKSGINKKLLGLAIVLFVFCQQMIAQPLVYSSENTGASCPAPPLPPLAALPTLKPLPDPFMWANGSGRSTSFSDWECRRNEIKAQIENYEIGRKPPRPANITASFAPNATGGILTINITENGQSMTMTSAIVLPSGSGPFPAIIGMNSATGSLPDSLFTNRKIAKITFSHDQVTTYNNPQITNPFFRLYPTQNLDNTGQYAAWAWGVSRIIDGLELVQASLPIDLRHIGVTGCSYAGKMALFAGAFDERIALTIAQESGGGGAPAWRASHALEPDGSVEKIDNTNYAWFKNDLRDFSGDNVYKLPYDHHELMAMVAPRALLVTGNVSQVWLSSQSAYITARATKSIYNTLGIGDRMGFIMDTDHGHCAIPTSEIPPIRAFIDKFLVGKTDVITDTVTVNIYPNVDYERWYKWWGTGRPVLPPLPSANQAEQINIWQEAECAAVGSQWKTQSDPNASKGTYVVAQTGVSNPTAPTDPAASTVFSFNVDQAGTYNVYARINQRGDDFTYWSKVDGGPFTASVSQLVKNPGFEESPDLTGWTNGGFFFGANRGIETNPANVHTGSKSLRVQVTQSFGVNYFVQFRTVDMPVQVGKEYEVTYWIKSTAPGSMSIQTAPGNITQGDQATDGNWQQIKWRFTATPASTQIQFLLGKMNNTYYIDDVTVKEVGSSEWIWTKLVSGATLSAGPHTVSIANAAGAAQLDKILISTSPDLPSGKGAEGTNCPCPAMGSTLYVNAAINNSSSTGASWSCAMPELSTAISYANTHPGITAIWVAKGVYKPGEDRSSSFTLTRSNLAILGGFNGSETDAAGADPTANRTILSGDIGVAGVTSDNSYHLFNIHGLPSAGTLEINGFEVVSGNANAGSGDNSRGAGAIIFQNKSNSDIRFARMKFMDNYSSGNGGALYVDGGSIQVGESQFIGNSATNGGAAYGNTASATFVKVLFDQNKATSSGGAYYSYFGNPNFDKSVFDGNKAMQDGGAVYLYHADAVHTNTVYNANSSQYGGAIYQYNNGESVITNSTFYGNAASVNGGALAMNVPPAIATCENTIFYKNTKAGAWNVAGADFINTSPGAKIKSSFRYSILQAGTAVPADNGANIANNQRGINPMFLFEAVPVGLDGIWGTSFDGLQLKAASPAVNSGNNAAASSMSKDLLGNDRIACAIVDKGAYENQACQTSIASFRNNAVEPAVSDAAVQLETRIINPFGNELILNYAGTEKANVQVVNATGVMIANLSGIRPGITRINSGSWSGGLYHVIIKTASGKQITLKAIRL